MINFLGISTWWAVRAVPPHFSYALRYCYSCLTGRMDSVSFAKYPVAAGTIGDISLGYRFDRHKSRENNRTMTFKIFRALTLTSFKIPFPDAQLLRVRLCICCWSLYFGPERSPRLQQSYSTFLCPTGRHGIRPMFQQNIIREILRSPTLMFPGQPTIQHHRLLSDEPRNQLLGSGIGLFGAPTGRHGIRPYVRAAVSRNTVLGILGSPKPIRHYGLP